MKQGGLFFFSPQFFANPRSKEQTSFPEGSPSGHRGTRPAEKNGHYTRMSEAETVMIRSCRRMLSGISCSKITQRYSSPRM